MMPRTTWRSTTRRGRAGGQVPADLRHRPMPRGAVMKIRLRSTTGRLGRRPAWQVLLVAGFPLSLWLLLPASASALITTGDGGWSWQNPLPQGDSLEAVATIDAQHAVAVGDCGAIITTADGGGFFPAKHLRAAGFQQAFGYQSGN